MSGLTYKVGTKVVHPSHGAGTIVCVQEKSIGDMHNTYYIIDTLPGDMQVMVPVQRAESVGLRQIGTLNSLRNALSICSTVPLDEEIEKDFRVRQAIIGEKIKSGSFEQVVSAVRVLFYMNSRRPLGMTDRRFIDQGKDILAGELALASDQEMSEAKQELEDCLAKMLEDQGE